MLNVILKNLNGHGSEAASLDAALVQLARDRDEVRARITELKQQKHQQLLDDASDADLDKVERLIARAETRLEKLNLAEAPLRERLTAAKGVAKKKAVERHFESMAGAYKQLRDAALAAEAAQVALMAARDAAVREVGEHAISSFPIFAYGGLLGHGMVQAWAADNDRILEAARASRQPRKPKVAEKPVKAAATLPSWLDRKSPGYDHPASQSLRNIGTTRSPDSMQHPIEMAGGVQTTPELLSAKRAADDLSPLKYGQVRVRILRNGYSPADNLPQCFAGQLVVMPRKKAEVVAAHGVVEITEELVPASATNHSPDKGELSKPV
jgi:hypothetical protein